jgi:hypothetical protein
MTILSCTEPRNCAVLAQPNFRVEFMIEKHNSQALLRNA